MKPLAACPRCGSSLIYATCNGWRCAARFVMGQALVACGWTGDTWPVKEET